MSAALDVKKLAPPQRPRTRHRIIGDPRTKDLHRGVGVDHPHCVVDDHSRLAYVELHAREDADTNIHTLERALRFFAELALDVVDPLHVAEMTSAERALLVARVLEQHPHLAELVPPRMRAVEEVVEGYPLEA
jgi:hypothetical protein